MADLPDVLMVNTVGLTAFSWSTTRTTGLGGSELEVVQIAHALADRGYSVVVANGVPEAVEENGVRYVPVAAAANHLPRQALYLERFSGIKLAKDPGCRIVVRATDVVCEPYEKMRGLFEGGRAALVGVSRWQLESSGPDRKGFHFAKERIVIPPMLGDVPKCDKIRGRFIYASNPIKGLESTLALWCKLKRGHAKVLDGAYLVVCCPGFMDGKTQKPPVELTKEQIDCNVSYIGAPTAEEYRRQIAMSEGLFFRNTFTETFGNVAALAERASVRTHILCDAGYGGLLEALRDTSTLTNSEHRFTDQFIRLYGAEPRHVETADHSPEALVSQWEEALHLARAKSLSVPAEVDPPKSTSHEASFPVESLPKNQPALPELFGTWLTHARRAIAPGGSELGLALGLFFLSSATRPERVVEIGRFKGFSTLALAAGLALQEHGWSEPKAAEQRPGVDYARLRGDNPFNPRLVSIDPCPMPEARQLLDDAGLSHLVEYVDKSSLDADVEGPIDLLFIDGDHSLEGVKADIRKFVPKVKQGGYFVLHDYFGWWKPDGSNGSPIKQAIDEMLSEGFERVLIDTGYASFVIFRKTTELVHASEPVPARGDGRPTVGLLLIAKNEGHVIARALASAKNIGVDAMTVVLDSDTTDQTADICRALGADVVVRKFPGTIAAARNDAIACAEGKTDYLLMLDPDDVLEGHLDPKLGDHDAYIFHIHEKAGAKYPRIQLFRSKQGWRYEGVRHETLVSPKQGVKTANQSTLIYKRVGGGSWQDRNPPKEKYLEHARDLEKWMIDHPDADRECFYLANSFRDAGEDVLAAKWYERRIQLGGWEEERFWSALELARIEDRAGRDPVAAYLRAHELSPIRAEPLTYAAAWLRDEKRGRYALAFALAKRAAEIDMPKVGLFIDDGVYTWASIAEVGIAGYFAGHYDVALRAFDELTRRLPKIAPAANVPTVQFAIDNANLCRTKIAEMAERESAA